MKHKIDAVTATLIYVLCIYKVFILKDCNQFNLTNCSQRHLQGSGKREGYKLKAYLQLKLIKLNHMMQKIKILSV